MLQLCVAVKATVLQNYSKKKKGEKKKVFTGILQSFEKRYTFTASIGINYGNPNQIHLIS